MLTEKGKMDQMKISDKGKTFDIFIPRECDLDAVNKVTIRQREFVPVVRCKDCAKRDNCDIDWRYRQSHNWYCADGERRE